MSFKDHPIWTSAIGGVLASLGISALSNLFAARWWLAEWLGRPTRWAWEMLSTIVPVPLGLILLGVGAGLWLLLPRFRRWMASRRGPPEPTVEEIQVLDNLRAFYRTHAEPAIDNAYELPNRLAMELADREPLAPLLTTPLSDFHTTRQEMAEGLDDKRHLPPKEAIRLLKRTLDQYQTTMGWVHKAELMGVELTEPPYVGHYRKWEERHEVLVEKLQELSGRKGLRELAKEADSLRGGVESGRNKARDLKARKRFKECTEDERLFLYYFAYETGPWDPADHESCVPNGVFRAGEKLVRDKFLYSETLPDAEGGEVVRFTLPHYSNEAIRGEIPVKRKIFDLPLAAIQGTMASGGGAGGMHTSRDP